MFVLSLALAGWATAGCGGGDDDSSSSGGGSGSGAGAGSGGASTGAGGAGGASTGTSGSTSTGQSGSGAAAGGMGGSTAAPVPCGSAMCQSTGRFLRACCFDQAAGKCGTQIAFGGNGMCNENVEADPRCDSIMAATITVPSCCTEDNRCGISFAMFGMPGCTSLEEAAMIAMGDGGMPAGGSGGGTNPFAVDLPPPRACE